MSAVASGDVVQLLEAQLSAYKEEVARLKEVHARELCAALQPAAAAAVPTAAAEAPVAAALHSASTPSAATTQLQKFVIEADKAGAYATKRYDYTNFGVGPLLFPSINSSSAAWLVGIDVHVTLPTNAPADQKLPVVFFFNCWAAGFEECKWYFPFAERLASYGYAVLQYHKKGPPPGRQQAYIVDCLLHWAQFGNDVAPGNKNPTPDFNASNLDPSRRAFVGHSRGGCDATYVFAHTPDDIDATAFILDGVDVPFFEQSDSSGAFAMQQGTSSSRAIALVRAGVVSGVGPVSFNPPSAVNALLKGANHYVQGRVVATTAVNTGHFNFVPEDLRVVGSGVLNFVNLETSRPYQTQGSDHSGVFNQCAGMLIAWLRDYFAGDLVHKWQDVFATGAWTDSELPQTQA